MIEPFTVHPMGACFTNLKTAKRMIIIDTINLLHNDKEYDDSLFFTTCFDERCDAFDAWRHRDLCLDRARRDDRLNRRNDRVLREIPTPFTLRLPFKDRPLYRRVGFRR